MTSEFRYEQPHPASPDDVVAAVDRGENVEASRTLIGAALYHPDWHEVQTLCLRLLRGQDNVLAATAATALGHLARIHRQLDVDTVREALEQAAQRGDEVISSRVSDALDDIEDYISR